MRVLFLLNRYPGVGGIENITTLLATLFKKDLGYETAIFSVVSEKDVQIPSSLVDAQILVKIASNTFEQNISYDFEQFFNKFNPSVVIFQDSYAEIEYLLSCVKSPVKLFVVEHNTPDCLLKAYVEHCRQHRWSTFGGLIRKCLFPIIYLHTLLHQKKRHEKLINMSDKYVVLSESYKYTLKKTYNINSDRIVAIPNIKNKFALTEVNLKKKKQVLFVGRLTKQKGVANLIEIWNIIENRTQEYKLVVVGDGEERKLIERKIADYGLRNVRLEGFRDNVYDYYNESSVFFLTSMFEGFPLVLPEAMQFGVIPFAFDTYSALKDVIDNNHDGYIVEPFNIQSYAETFLEFITKSPEEVLTLRQTAIESSRRFDEYSVLSLWKSIL